MNQLSLNFESNVDLFDANTLRIPAKAEQYIAITEAKQLEAIANHLKDLPKPLILGGGSNLVLPDRLPMPVLHLKNKGFEQLSDAPSGTSRVRIAAGEVWHDTVSKCVALGLSGLENLALIPGSVGAAPIQNIGAYGVEVREILHSVEVYDLQNEQWLHLPVESLELGYRRSRFQSEDWNGRMVVWSVTLELSRSFTPRLSYPALGAVFANKPPKKAQEVMQAVMNIRKSKLPDVAVEPNAGSFFKNPVLPSELVAALRQQFPDLVSFPVDDHQEKIAAGWLIEQAGLKGAWNQNKTVGCSASQALVLINQGGSAQDVLDWALEVKRKVHQTFGVELAIEPVCIKG